MKILKFIAYSVIGAAVVYFGLVAWLVFSVDDDPFADYPQEPGTWEQVQATSGAISTLHVPFEERVFTARDGEALFTRVYGQDNGTTVILLHGIASSSDYMNNAAGALIWETDLRVITPDMRGVGQSGGKRYTVDYIGQYEDDVTDIIRALRQDNPQERIILAGHSMGGGVMLRYALLEDAPAVDGYLLFAPNFGDGPTQGGNSDMSEEEKEIVRGYVHFSIKRIIGLVLLDTVGITALQDMPVVWLNAPPEMPAYSFASVMSGQPNKPEDAPVALVAIDAPLIVIVGENDDNFIATAYEPMVLEYSDGETVLIPGAGHADLLNSGEAMNVALEWLSGL